MYSKKGLISRIILAVFGLALIALTFAEVLDSPIYAGLGGAFAAIGVLQAIRILRYMKDEAYREHVDTEENDERNRFLRMKSWSLAGSVAFMLQGIGVIVAAILGERTIQLVLTCAALLILAVYLVSLAVLNKKY